MNSEQIEISQPDISKLTGKDDQVNDLMKSIQNKLSMLACDDSASQFETSKLSSPKREFLTATNEKRTRAKMNIHDLETSNHRQTKESPSRLGQSRILSRINEIQHFYMDKIQQMSTKCANMQFQIETLGNLNEQLQKENAILKFNLNKKQQEQDYIVNSKIEQLRLELIEKFSREAQEHFENHMKELKKLNQELLSERGKRKYLQQQVALVRNEKNNLEEFYRSLLDNHRKMLQFEIQQTEKGMRKKSSYSEKNRNQEQSSQPVKKAKKKEKLGQSKKSQQMTNEQMIPFLAKGIQQLKDKLKIR